MTQPTTTAKPKPPAGLKTAGKRLWKSVTEVFGLEVRELEVLAMACRQADDLAALDAAIDRYGLMIEGSKGQDRINPLVTEARQARLALTRLLGDLSLPDDTGQGELPGMPPTQASRRAQKAANVRWRMASGA